MVTSAFQGWPVLRLVSSTFVCGMCGVCVCVGSEERSRQRSSKRAQEESKKRASTQAKQSKSRTHPHTPGGQGVPRVALQGLEEAGQAQLAHGVGHVVHGGGRALFVFVFGGKRQGKGVADES